MKKAIIVLLLLAFVAGGLFAQDGLTFGGRVMAGIGMWKIGDNDPGWGIATSAGTTRGMRLNFTAAYTNADKNKGFNLYLRARGASYSNRVFSPASGGTFEILYAQGWFTAFDGLLKINGGKTFDTPFGYTDWWGQDDPADASYGLYATIKASDAIRVGFGMNSRNGLDRGVPFGGRNSTGPTDNDGDYVNGINTWVGFRGEFGVVDTRAYFKIRKDYMELHVGAVIEVGDLEIAIPIYVYDLSNYSDSGEFIFLPYVTFGGIENMSINVFGQLCLDGSGGDPSVGGMIAVDYKFGNIIPRLAVAYMSGATYCGASYGLKECIWDFNKYDKGYAYLLIRPQLRCRTSSSSYIDFAGVFSIQTGDKKPSNPVSIGALIDFNVSF